MGRFIAPLRRIASLVVKAPTPTQPPSNAQLVLSTALFARQQRTTSPTARHVSPDTKLTSRSEPFAASLVLPELSTATVRILANHAQ